MPCLSYCRSPSCQHTSIDRGSWHEWWTPSTHLYDVFGKWPVPLLTAIRGSEPQYMPAPTTVSWTIHHPSSESQICID